MLWLCQALENLGHDVVRVWGRTGLELADGSCELVIFQQKGVIRWPNLRDLIQTRKAIWAYLWYDLVSLDPYKPVQQQGFFKKFEPQFREMDVVFLKERGLIDEWKHLGINAHFLDQGCPSSWKASRNREPGYDVVGWGQLGAWYKERTDILRAVLKMGFKVAWATDAADVPRGVTRIEWTHPDDLSEFAETGRCVLSVGRRNDVEGYTSDSFWLACGTGRPVVRQRTRGLPDGPYWQFSDKQELRDAIENCVFDPILAEERARKCREWVMREHTIEHRCRDMLEIVNAHVITATA